MDLQLSGKTALVTGASKGIGLATAKLLADEGCNLHLAARTRADLEAARDAIRKRHNVAVTIHDLDLGDAEARRGLAEATMAGPGGIDILINNAGAIPFGPLDVLDDAAWRAAWELKLFGYIDLTRAIYPAMCRRGHGVIVNVIGGGGERPSPGYIAGSIANAGLMAMTRGLGGVSLDHGVRVVGVNPGPIETERLRAMHERRAAQTLGDAARWRELLASLPQGRAGTVEECAAAIAFLASPRASWISGTVVTVDGGGASRVKNA